MGPRIKNDLPLKNLTTFNIGGSARYYAEVNSITELTQVMEWVARDSLNWFVLGKGSNVLISDKGFNGLVLVLGSDFSSIEIDEQRKVVKAGGAVYLPELGWKLAKRGYPGFEFMCGIPGSIGGGVYINAGTKQYGEIKDNFLACEIYDPGKRKVVLDQNDIKFSYRHSSLMGTKKIVLSATFSLDKEEAKGVIKSRIENMIEERRSKRPVNPKNCGSIFKRPSGGKSAGWYIERAGLKGKIIGGARISKEHSNWIVNENNATAEDVKSLILSAESEVYERFGVELQREVFYVPEDIA
jgi:UDP-N-acetylmuramate dehydrogenase